MNNKEIKEFNDKYVMATYARFPVTFVKGKGARVWDIEGKCYIDFVAGIAVNNLGHCHPKIMCAARNQIGKLIHTSNLYYILPQAKLARFLVEHSFADKAFFCNSGAEANEAAVKLARKYMKDKGKKGSYEIITMLNSFHGRTLSMISATGQEKVKKGFEPMVQGFIHVEFNNIDAIKKAITDKTCAIMLEPIQGEGGVNIPSENYLKDVRKICDEKGILLIFDEIQTGMGRTGRLFAYENYGMNPDIMTLAKGLAGGLPIGAMLAKDEIAKSFGPGTHASTFGGNPVVCAAGLAALKVITEKRFLNDVIRMEKYIVEKVFSFKEKYKCIKGIRSKGLMIGIELNIEGKSIVESALKNGLLINCTVDKVLRLLPGLNITKKEVDTGLKILENSLKVTQEGVI